MSSTCPICLEELVDKNTASLDVCDHIFCQDCLEKWSKHGSYCPVDRKRFKKIISLNSENVIQIKPCKPKRSRVLYDVTVFCEVCKKLNNAGSLLLCDCCDLGYHCKCLSPPLEEVPVGQWYCPVCSDVENRIKTAKAPTKEIQFMIEEQNALKYFDENAEKPRNSNVLESQTNDGNIHNIKDYDSAESHSSHLKSEKDDKPLAVKEVVRTYLDKKHTNNISDTQSSLLKCFKSKYIEDYDTNGIVLGSIRKRDNKKLIKYPYKATDVESESECQSINKDIEILTETNKGTILKGCNTKKNSNRKVLDNNRDGLEVMDCFPVSQTNFVKNEESNQNIRKTCAFDPKKSCDKKCVEGELIDIGDYFPATLSNTSRKAESIPNIEEQCGGNEIMPASLKKKRGKNFTREKTIDIGYCSPATETNFAKSVESILKIENPRVETEIVKTILRKKRTKKYVQWETIDSGNYSPATETNFSKSVVSIQKIENPCTENIKSSLRKNRTKKCVQWETINIGDGSPATETNFAKSVESIQKIENPRVETEIVKTSLRKIRTKKCVQGETIDSGDYSPATQTNFAKSVESIQKIENPRVETEIVKTSLRKNRTKKCVQGETIDSGDYSPATQTNFSKSGVSIQKIENPCTENVKSSLRKNRTKKCVQWETIDIGDDSPATETNFAKSVESIQKFENPSVENVKSSLRKNHNKKCVQGDTIDVKNYSTQQSNIQNYDESIHSINEQHNNMDIALTGLQKNDNIIQTVTPSETRDLEGNSSVNEIDIAKTIHNCQEHSEKITASKSIRATDYSKIRDHKKEEIISEIDFSARISSITKNECAILTSQSVEKVNLKKNDTSKCKFKAYDNLKIQTIKAEKDKVPDSHEQHGKKDIESASLMKLKESLIENGFKSRSTTGLYAASSTDKIVQDNLSTAVEQTCIRKKESISNSMSLNLEYPKTIEVKSQSKAHNREKKQNKVFQTIGGTCQQKMMTKNLYLQDFTSLNSGFFCNDIISRNSVQSTKSFRIDCNSSSKATKNEDVTFSQFSVFEPLEDTVVSSQKYLNINLAVRKMGPNPAHSLFREQFLSPKKSHSTPSENINSLLKSWNSCERLEKSCKKGTKQEFLHKPLQNNSARQLNYAIKAKMDLAEELKKIEQEKWTSSLKKKKYLCSTHSDKTKKFRKDLLNFYSKTISK